MSLKFTFVGRDDEGHTMCVPCPTADTLQFVEIDHNHVIYSYTKRGSGDYHNHAVARFHTDGEDTWCIPLAFALNRGIPEGAYPRITFQWE